MRWLNNTEGRRDQICPKLEYFRSVLFFRTLFTFRTFEPKKNLSTFSEISLLGQLFENQNFVFLNFYEIISRITKI